MSKLTRGKTQLDLDGLYPVGEIAPWLRLSPRTVMELARQGKLPAVRLNERVIRFHPRTILASKLRTLPA